MWDTRKGLWMLCYLLEENYVIYSIFASLSMFETWKSGVGGEEIVNEAISL